MPQERIEVIFVAKGQRQVERSIVQMAKAADSLSKSADRATKSIGQMGKSSGGTGKVSTGVQKASRDVKRLGNDAQKTAGRVNSLWKSPTVPAATGASLRETGRALNSLAGRFAAFYTGRVLIGISDEFGRMSNVLSGFGVAAGEIDKVRKSINKVANAARVDAVQASTSTTMWPRNAPCMFQYGRPVRPCQYIHSRRSSLPRIQLSILPPRLWRTSRIRPCRVKTG